MQPRDATKRRRRASSSSSSSAAAAAAKSAAEARAISQWIETWKPKVTVAFHVFPGNRRYMFPLWSNRTIINMDAMELYVMNKADRKSPNWIMVTASLFVPELQLEALNVLRYRQRIDTVADKYVTQWTKSPVAAAGVEVKEGEDSSLWLTLPSPRHLQALLRQQLEAMAIAALTDVWRRKQHVAAILLANTEIPQAVLQSVLSPYVSYRRRRSSMGILD